MSTAATGAGAAASLVLAVEVVSAILRQGVTISDLVAELSARGELDAKDHADLAKRGIEALEAWNGNEVDDASPAS